MKYFEKARNEIIRISEADTQTEERTVFLPIHGGTKMTGGLYVPSEGNFEEASESNYFFGFFVDEKNQSVYKVWYEIPHEEPEDWPGYLDTVDYGHPDACAVIDWDIDDPDIAELRLPQLDAFEAWFR